MTPGRLGPPPAAISETRGPGRRRRRPAAGPNWKAVGALALWVAGRQVFAAEPPPWEMDYGPFLTASIEAPEPRTNIACKGVAIPLGDGAGADRRAVLFDTDLLRYAAGWQGGFVALKGVVYDGEHWAYPRMEGEQLFGNPPIPGWSRSEDFRDPREFPYGPLPRDWAHWRGLYLQGQQVVLSYTVGKASVLELPGLEQHFRQTAFSRSFELGPAAESLTLQVAFDDRRRGRALRLDQPETEAIDLSAQHALVVLEPVRGRADAPPVDLARNLAAWWTFDDAAGTSASNSVITGQALQFGTGARGPGLAGAAAELTGTDYGQIAAPDALDFARNDLTLAAWVRPAGDGPLVAEMGPSGPWAPDAKALFLRDGRLCFDVGWVGCVESAGKVEAGRWTHVALTWAHAESVATLYLDGRAEGRGTLKPRGALANAVLRVGFAATNFPATPRFRGQVDDLRLYSRALSEPELSALAGAGADTTCVVAAAVGLPVSARWQLEASGHLRLRLPPASGPRRFKVLVARTTPERIAEFAALVRAASPAPGLEPLTHGGPARWARELVEAGQLGSTNGPFAIDTLRWPDPNPWRSWMRFGGFDFFRDPTRAAITTWNGDVWTVSGLDASLRRLTWRRIATGLYQPLGLRIVDDQIYVLGRDQITRLHDLDGDGEADFYENFNNDTMNTEHFHEFVLDLQTDAEGNFYYMKGARHARDALHPQHGTLMKVSPDGRRSEIIANGFRAPNGLGLAPDGRAFSTDQEGYWMPANRLNWIRPGRFYGNVWSWFPGAKPTAFEPPICWIHPRIDRSPSTMVWVDSPRWGPLQHQLLSLSYGVGRVFLVLTENAGDGLQGGITPLPVEFETGIMRARFHPADGQLYVCGLYGWAGNKTQPGGFYRLRYTGQPLHLPVALHSAPRGLVVTFSDPLDPVVAADPGNYGVESWNYRWTENYGSPDFRRDGEKGRDRLTVRAANVSADARSVYLEIPDLQPAMQVHVQLNLRAADGAAIQTYVHHTLRQLAAREPAGWADRAPTAPAAPAAAVLRQPAVGLVQTLSAADPSTPPDQRVVRLVQVHVPAGEAVSPFVPAGRFRARWEGWVRLDVRESFRVSAVGRGQVRVQLNDREVLAGPLAEIPAPGPLASLSGGLNRVVVEYDSPETGDARLRLFWSNDAVAAEPLPPQQLFHEADDPHLAAALRRRQARVLFADHYCAACHAPPPGRWNFPDHGAPGAMPELAARAAALDGAGDRFQEEWVARWLPDPAALVANTRMPRCLTGAPAEREQPARDLAAFLASLRAAGGPEPEPSFTDAQAAAGEKLFGTLGCAACHVRPGDKLLTPDDRRSLSQVRSKWKPAALVAFLQKPDRHQPWSRMPDFQLTPESATALAAHLFARTEPGPAGVPGAAAGDAARGREAFASLGCVHCHAVEGMAAPQSAPALDALAANADARGCLAEPAARGRAPDFGLDPDERAQLRELLQRDAASLARDTWGEYAARQRVNLRCQACHSLDGTGDFWSRLEALDPAPAAAPANPYDDQESPAERTIHRQRPPLTWAGEKLRPEWVERFLGGKLSYKPRPKLEARMPAFPAYARGLAAGLAAEHGLPDATPAEPPPDPQRVEVGRALIPKGALSCVDCHAVGAQPALAGADTVTLNFAYIPERLRREYYDRYVLDPPRWLPGTMMPKFANDAGQTGLTQHYEGDARRQFDAIWHFLRTVPPPDAK